MKFSSPIPASHRASRRAAFRRVSGGVSREVAVARDARPYQRMLQRFQRVGVEEEIDNIQALDAIVVKRGIVVEREQELWMVVADGFEWGEFAGQRCLVAHGVCHLEVSRDPVFKSHEIDLAIVENADVDLAETAAEFEVYDILEEMSEIFALRSKKRAAKARVGNVVLRRRFEILPAFDVVAVNPVEKKGLAEGFNVSVERCMRHGETLALEHSNNLVHREQIADVVKKEFGDAFECRGVAVTVSRHDIFVEDRVKDAGKVVVLGTGSVFKLSGEGEASESQEVAEYGMGIAIGEQGEVFGEMERLEPYFDITTREECRQFAREEFCIRAGDVNIKILAGVETVNELLEFGNVLDFVKKDVGLANRLYVWLDKLPCFAPTCEGCTVGILEVYRDYLVCRHSIGGELFSEQFKKRGLSATADASHYFDDILAAPTGKPVGEPFSADFAIVHGRKHLVLLKFVGMIAFFVGKVNRHLQLHGKHHKFKSEWNGVLTPCRTSRRAAFRRVAGGVSSACSDFKKAA